jgi:ribosome recycling factor
MIKEIETNTSMRMQKCVEAFKHELSKIRTGRAHPSLLEQIMVPYYEADTPLSQVANIGVEDARTLTVTPWEKHLVGAIEKAIMSADLGLNPSTTGEVIRVPMPPLTEERRRELVKVVKAEAENSRVSIRNIRRDANTDIKEALKEKMVNEDDAHKAEDRIQKITNSFVEKIEDVLKTKETDLLAI